MAHPDTIQLLKNQMRIERYEQGWHWETDEFCCEDFLPSREACIADFNQFVTSGELDKELAKIAARPTYNAQDLDALVRQVNKAIATLKETVELLGEGFPVETSEPDRILFNQVKDLEGNLSHGQITRIELQVKQEQAGFTRYVELMEVELYGATDDSWDDLVEDHDYQTAYLHQVMEDS